MTQLTNVPSWVDSILIQVDFQNIESNQLCLKRNLQTWIRISSWLKQKPLTQESTHDSAAELNTSLVGCLVG